MLFLLQFSALCLHPRATEGVLFMLRLVDGSISSACRKTGLSHSS